MSNDVTIGPVQYADKGPSPERLKRYRELAKLKLDQAKNITVPGRGAAPSFKTGFEEGFKDCWQRMHVEEFWAVIQRIAILDETLRWPSMEPPQGVQQKFEALMQLVQQLAFQIQQEQGYKSADPVN